MANGTNKLTAVAIKAATTGSMHDGGGLVLEKKGDIGKWTYRYFIGGRRREMGLGTYPDVGLAEARRERDKWVTVLRSGLDPINERRRRLEAEATAVLFADGPTLEELVGMAFDAKKAGLKGEGLAGRWMSPLNTHVLPKLGHRRVGAIHQTDLRNVLAPIWRTKHATALKALRRLRGAFELGRLAGLPCDPFIIDAAKQLLGDYHHEEKPIAATPWQEIPDLFAKLGANPTSSNLCLQLIILTAVRSDAASGIRIDEIEGDIWTVPKERIKGRIQHAKEFRCPLSGAALEVIERALPSAVDGFLFAGRKRDGSFGPISANATEKAMNDIGEPGRPHGLRTSFRTWAQDTEPMFEIAAETQIGHVIGNKVRRAYARSDLLDQRRILLGKWANYVTSKAD